MAEPVPVPVSAAHGPIFNENSPTSAPRSPVAMTEIDVSVAPSSWEVESQFEGTVSRLKQAVARRASEHPLELVLGVAVISFVAGIALRLWRGNHG